MKPTVSASRHYSVRQAVRFKPNGDVLDPAVCVLLLRSLTCFHSLKHDGKKNKLYQHFHSVLHLIVQHLT